MYMDPWHLFQSMPQYLLIAASFTNILVRLSLSLTIALALNLSAFGQNVYAFANLHDVS